MAKLKKTLAMFLVFAIVFSLTACQTDAAPESSVVASQSNAAQGSAGGGSDKITITYQTWKGGDRTLDYSEYEGFENINIEFLTLELEDSYSKMKIDLAAGGSEVDVYAVYGRYMFNAVSDYMIALDSYIAADLGADWKSKFPESYLKEMTDDNGELKAIACGFIDEGLWLYNADIFEKYNVQAPKTYDELVSLCAVMKADGFVPAMIGGSEGWLLAQFALSIAAQTAPGEIYKAISLEQSWNTPGIIETFRVFQQTFQDVWQDGAVTATHYGDSYDALKNQQTAMFLGGVAAIGGLNIESLADVNFQSFPFPDVTGDGSSSKICAGPDEQIMVNKNSAHIEEAVKLAAFWGYGPGYDIALNKKGGTYGYFSNQVPDTSSWFPDAAGLFDSCMKTYPDIQFSTSLAREDSTAILHEALKQLAAYTITPEQAVAQLDEDCSFLS